MATAAWSSVAFASGAQVALVRGKVHRSQRGQGSRSVSAAAGVATGVVSALVPCQESTPAAPATTAAATARPRSECRLSCRLLHTLSLVRSLRVRLQTFNGSASNIVSRVPLRAGRARSLTASASAVPETMGRSTVSPYPPATLPALVQRIVTCSHRVSRHRLRSRTSSILVAACR